MLRELHDRTNEIGEKDGKLARLKELLSGDLKGKKVLIFSSFKDTTRYLHRKLVERLTTRISTIDDLGLLDSSVLGEVVHPRTFNTLRRILEGDNTVLDEEEERAELAGPEKLLRDLKDMLNRDGADQMIDLPNGIHSGLRREKCHGMFFYFQAPRADGIGRRHFWRYVDAKTHEILENRFEIADRIACQPDEPRYVAHLFRHRLRHWPAPPVHRDLYPLEDVSLIAA
ncbi:MAG: hypothetical protein ACHRXM_07150 [Isosphaerales bacterium]